MEPILLVLGLGWGLTYLRLRQTTDDLRSADAATEELVSEVETLRFTLAGLARRKKLPPGRFACLERIGRHTLGDL